MGGSTRRRRSEEKLESEVGEGIHVSEHGYVTRRYRLNRKKLQFQVGGDPIAELLTKLAVLRARARLFGYYCK